MRWSITAWSSPEVSSRPIASSASVSCRRRSTPAAATRSRSTASGGQIRNAAAQHGLGHAERRSVAAPDQQGADGPLSPGVDHRGRDPGGEGAGLEEGIASPGPLTPRLRWRTREPVARGPWRPERRRPRRARACPRVPAGTALSRDQPAGAPRRRSARRPRPGGRRRRRSRQRRRAPSPRGPSRLQQTAKGSQGLPLARAHVVPRSRHGSAHTVIGRSARAPSRATRSASTRETPPTSTIRRGIAGDANPLAPRGSPWLAPRATAPRLFAPTGG